MSEIQNKSLLSLLGNQFISFPGKKVQCHAICVAMSKRGSEYLYIESDQGKLFPSALNSESYQLLRQAIHNLSSLNYSIGQPIQIPNLELEFKL